MNPYEKIWYKSLENLFSPLSSALPCGDNISGCYTSQLEKKNPNQNSTKANTVHYRAFSQVSLTMLQ